MGIRFLIKFENKTSSYYIIKNKGFEKPVVKSISKAKRRQWIVSISSCHCLRWHRLRKQKAERN